MKGTPPAPLDESSADRPFGRPFIVLIGLAVFLVTYLVGILRQQPFAWVAASSAVALLVMVGAGLVIERILGSPAHAEVVAEDGPAVTYVPAPRVPTSERRGDGETASLIPGDGDD
jgi:hypothetical protein